MTSDKFKIILHHVERSIHGEQIFCTYVTEMKYMAPFKDQIGLKMVHRENYETSYHRNTAAGNLKRLVAGAGLSEHQLIRMTVECFLETQKHDHNAEQALEIITVETPQQETWKKTAIAWHVQRTQDLQKAIQLLRESIPLELWNQGVSLME